MASSDARPIPKKNTAYRHYFAIRDSVGELVTSWAGQDSKLSKDGAAFGDADNEAVEIGSSGIGYIDLTAAEMNYDAVILKVTITNTNALTYLVVLFPEETGDIRADAASILGTALTETSTGYLAAAVVKLFDVATPLLVASDAMRGTDNAALASVWTAARAGALTDWLNGGRLDKILDAILEDTGTTLPEALANGTVQVGTIRDGAIGEAAVADIFSSTALTEAYTTSGATGTPAQLLYEMLQNITEFAIDSTIKTVKRRDGSATAATYTLDDDTTPTSITRSD